MNVYGRMLMDEIERGEQTPREQLLMHRIAELQGTIDRIRVLSDREIENDTPAVDVTATYKEDLVHDDLTRIRTCLITHMPAIKQLDEEADYSDPIFNDLAELDEEGVCQFGSSLSAALDLIGRIADIHKEASQ